MGPSFMGIFMNVLGITQFFLILILIVLCIFTLITIIKLAKKANSALDFYMKSSEPKEIDDINIPTEVIE